MSENFKPLTNPLGVPGTSYKMQLGLVHNQWASRLLKGVKVLAEKTYNLLEDEEYPNTNFLVGFVLQNAAIPNINPRQIMKVTESLLNRAIENIKTQNISIAKSKPEDMETESISTQETGKISEEEKRKKFQERMKARQEEGQAKATSKRNLPKVPSARGTPSPPSASPKPSSSPPKSKPEELPKEEEKFGGHKFCPYCGGIFNWKYCPYCGKKL